MLIQCPTCQSLATIPIYYGKADTSLIDASIHGLCITAGCVIEANSPNRHCKQCLYEWTHPETEAPIVNSRTTTEPIPVARMRKFLSNYEFKFSQIYLEIEAKYLLFGLSPLSTNTTELSNLLNTYNYQWLVLLDHLYQEFGDLITLQDKAGNIVANYAYRSASIYLLKLLPDWSYNISMLAQASFSVGLSTHQNNEGNTSKTLQQSLSAVREAHGSIEHNWNELKQAAVSYFD